MRCLVFLTVCVVSVLGQHVHSANNDHRESLLLSNEYYRQPYRTPVNPTHQERDHHERDILRTPYEPLRQYENEQYRLRQSQLRAFEDAGEPADYFRDRFGRRLIDEGFSARQYSALGSRSGRSNAIRVAQEGADHGYADSVPYHTSGNRFFTDVDGQANYRNFDINGGANHARYTVRTGSEPSAQDGPIVAFASSSRGHAPAKVFVRDVPIYF